MKSELCEDQTSENLKMDEQRGLKNAESLEVKPTTPKKQFEVPEQSSACFSEITEILLPNHICLSCKD